MTTPSVLVDHSESVTTISINRPEARNALNREVIALLKNAFVEIASRLETRVVVLTGAGQDSFCAGADLSELVHESTPEGRRAFFHSVVELIEAVHRCRAPVVAKIYGFALAGGCGLAAACDISVSSDDALFGLPEVALGLAPMVVMAPIHRAIGRRALSELALLGDRISATRAYEIGLISKVVQKAAVEGECQRLVSRLQKMSPEAVARSKRAILDVSEKDYFDFIGELADRSALLSLEPEACEGLAAFLEKRAPTWREPQS
jgi:enoyl-CoA hydratase/carnithine racemase